MSKAPVANPRAVLSALALRRSGTLARFATLEVMNQGLRMGIALLVIRHLPVQEYAWYSLINSFWGSLALVSATGVGGGLLALGGAAIKDPEMFGDVVKTAAEFRGLFIAIALLFGIPLFAVLLHRNQADATSVSILLLLGSSLLVLEAMTQTVSTVLALRREYAVPQKAELVSNCLRVVFLGGLFWCGVSTAVSVLGVTACTSAISFLGLLAPKMRGTLGASRGDKRKELIGRFRTFTLHGLPGNITIVAQGQISLLMLAWCGGSHNVASLGALTRLGLLAALPNAYIGKVLIPRMAAEPSSEGAWRLWKTGLFAVSLVAIGIIGASWVFPGVVRLVLGLQYVGLKEWLAPYAWVVGGALICFQTGAIATARGWVRHSWIKPALVIALQGFAISHYDVSSIGGAIMLSAAGLLANFLGEVIFVVRGKWGKGAV